MLQVDLNTDIQAIVEMALTGTGESAMDARRCLRVLLEWYAIGRPADRIDEFRALVPANAGCALDLSCQQLLELEIAQDELRALSSHVLACLSSRDGGYRWVTYILKGLSGFFDVEDEMTEFVETHWREEDEDLIEQTVLIHFNVPMSARQSKILSEISKYCESEALRGSVEMKMRVNENNVKGSL